MPLKIAIIGAGPAGYPAALTAARLGAQVSVIDPRLPGGVCLHCGCIPSKSLLDAAHRLDAVRKIDTLCSSEATAHAQAILKEISWPKIQQRQQEVTRKLAAGIQMLFRQAKVTYYQGTASFIDEHTLRVDRAGEELTLPFDYALIATGSTAFVPPPFDKIRAHIQDNSTVFALPQLPKEMVIIGGGAIGCEFATLLSALGVKITLIEMQPRLLPAMDEPVSRLLAVQLQKRGVNVLPGKKITDAHVQGRKKILTLDDGATLETEEVLVAIGRQCDLAALHPENAGLKWNRKGLEGVHPHTLQAAPSIYAAGDVTGLTLLAHAASRQGVVAAHNMCGQPMQYDNDAIPSAVYTSPEVAAVGLTRAQAAARGLEVKMHKAFMAANGRALTQESAEGFVEILSEKTTGKLLGATLAAPQASEIISLFSVALAAQMTVQQLQNVVLPHPTVSEAVADALAR